MFYIEDEKIYLTRGDSAAIQMDCVTASGETYVMGENDVLQMTVRELPDAASPVLLSISSQPGSNRLILSPADTRDLDVGEYSADIQLTTGEGDIYTLWPKLEGRARARVQNYRNFVLMSEVSIHE